MSRNSVPPSLSSLRALLPDVHTVDVNNLPNIPAPGVMNDEKEARPVMQNSLVEGEQTKLKASMEEIKQDIKITLKSMDSVMKKQGDNDSVSNSLKKKINTLELRNTATENISKKQDSKIHNVNSQIENVRKEMKALEKKLITAEGKKSVTRFRLVQEQLKSLEDEVVGIFKTTLEEVENSKATITNLEHTIMEMKHHMLSILDHCGSTSSSASDSGNVFLLKLVKDQLALLTRDVSQAQEQFVEKIEQEKLNHAKEITLLKNMIREKQPKREKIEKRVARLEELDDDNVWAQKKNMSDRKVDRDNISKLRNMLKDEVKKNNKLEQRIVKLESTLKYYIPDVSAGASQQQTATKKKETAPTANKVGTNTIQGSKPVTAIQSKSVRKEKKKKQELRIQENESNAVKTTPSDCTSNTSSTSSAKGKKKETLVMSDQDRRAMMNKGDLPAGSIEGGLSYFEKAQLYLLNQVESQLLQSGQTSGALESNIFSATVLDQKSVVKEPILQQAPIDWAIRKQRDATSVLSIQYGSIFYTKTPGYRMQFRAQIDQLHGDIYFSVRILKGVFDDQLKWPFTGSFKIRVNHKTSKKEKNEEWVLPANGQWEGNMRKAVGKRDRVYSEWVGPFDISRLLEKDTFYLLFDLV